MTKLGERENEELLFNGHRVSVLQDEKILDIHCTAVTTRGMYFTSVNLKVCKEGLPWWSSGFKPARQCRGREFDPYSGKIPHAVE